MAQDRWDSDQLNRDLIADLVKENGNLKVENAKLKAEIEQMKEQLQRDYIWKGYLRNTD